MTAAAQVGDTTFLANYLINTKVYAVVVPPGDTTNQEFVATFEVQGDQGTLTMAAIIGPRGPAGLDMFILTLQTDTIDDPADLPQTLKNNEADTGKFWVFDDVDGLGNIIGSSGYIWYGTSYRRIMLGTPGPPGPVPIITPSVELVDPDVQSSDVVTGGTSLFPTMNFQLAVPPGPPGPGAALAVAPDVDLSTVPVAGDILGFTGRYTTSGAMLSPPQHFQAVASNSGGTLPAGTHYYVATFVNANGETTASNEVSVTTTGTTGSVALSWTPNLTGGIVSTNIYRGSVAGAESALVHTVAGPAHTYTDIGGTIVPGSAPTVNSAFAQFPIWVPVSVSSLIPSPFSMPENSFTSFSGISQRAAIGSFVIPAQPFPWTPICWGHLGAFGLELSANPLLIGAEIRLGDPTAGQLISRGFGNTLGEVNFMPHYSDPNTPGRAITPENGVGAVPANHTSPAQGTIYVNLYNDGAIGIYQFSPTDAQIYVQVTPVTPTTLGRSPALATRRKRG